MHIVVLTLYGLICWLSAMAYAVITAEFSVITVALAGPFIISSAVLVLILIDTALWSLSSMVRRWLRISKASSNG